MMMKKFLLPLVAVITVTWPVLCSASVQPDTSGQALGSLAPFERLVGGRWQLGGSYQEFEWGVGRRSVSSRGYVVVDGKPRLVSEGVWFWHPGEEQIKGVFTAIDMPVEFFDYTTRFEDNRMVNDLVSYGADGETGSYVETWEFTDETHYVWRLFQKMPEGLQEVMGGTYSKRDSVESSSEAELEEMVRTIVEDAQTANIEGLQTAHLVSDKFTKFGPRRFERQDVAATNESEAAFFGSISNYQLETEDLKIDVFGDMGIVTYYPHVSFVQEGVEKTGSGRQTLVFLKTDDGWKIVHEHGTPRRE